MTEAIPHAVLSEGLRDRLGRRTVEAAVFSTFRFDPGFFEQEVLPVLFDVQFHQDPAIRKLQLEDLLRPLSGRVAVYYDARALEEGGRGPASLDVRRVPVAPSTGYFHPKNVLLLAADPDTGQRSLVVVTGSANLTQAGWWENVECAHIDVLPEDRPSKLRDGLLQTLDHVAQASRTVTASAAPGPRSALKEITQFVRQLPSVPYRSADGRLHPHFLASGRRSAQSFAGLLRDALRGDFRGAKLEIISPYLDDAAASEPLRELLDLLQPSQWRVLLPEDRGGARCQESMYDWLVAAGGQWGRLPGALTSAGDRGAPARRVHAKVYRLFTSDREVIVLGSFNLTRAAHQAGGNVETAVLVEGPAGRRRRRFWLQPVEERPAFVEPADEGEGADPDFVPLAVRYHWDTGRAEALWYGSGRSPRIHAYAQDVHVFTVTGLTGRTWADLPADDAEALGSRLRSTSLLALREGERRGVTLVLEEGMAHRPSLLLDLSLADILRYWSLLTADQRAAVIAEHAERLPGLEGIERLAAQDRNDPAVESVFDRHAGMFHGFASLTRAVVGALNDGGEEVARFRMFGAKYDSLPVLVERLAHDDAGDPLDRYLMLLCARQLADRVRRDWPEFWAGEPVGTARLDRALAARHRLREQLTARNDDRMGAFLGWFEPRFLREAEAATA